LFTVGIVGRTARGSPAASIESVASMSTADLHATTALALAAFGGRIASKVESLTLRKLWCVFMCDASLWVQAVYSTQV
jgi:hypothetical protein